MSSLESNQYLKRSQVNVFSRVKSMSSLRVKAMSLLESS